ncbi:MAG: alpha/beta hydrolase [Candidatus Gastranaerophilales bacterium]|nr:alpha/beta hydrolase [Candidatus Gastranaerophilales bacterium]
MIFGFFTHKLCFALIKRFIVYTLILLFLYILATNFIYFPSPYHDEPAKYWEDVYFSSGNSVVYGRYIKAKDGLPTVIFSHGNGGNAANWFPVAAEIHDKTGYGFLLYDYRGYGKSKGFTCEKNTYEDLRSAIKFVNNEKNIPNENIILYGISVGGAVTAQVASEQKFKGVILHNTFTNIRDMAQTKLVQVFFFNSKNKFINNFVYKIVYHLPMFQPFDTKNKIDKISSKLIIFHSKEDTMIPYTMSETLFLRNKSAKLITGFYGDHNDFFICSDMIVKSILEF